MIISLKYLETCKEMQIIIDQAYDLLNGLNQPVIQDRSIMKTLHERMKAELEGQSKSIAIRVELLILLYLYAPSKIVDTKKKGCRVYNDISGTMGVDTNSLSKYKVTLLDYYKYNKPFRDLTNKVFEKLTSDL